MDAPATLALGLVTAPHAAALALLQVVLAFRVAMHRRRSRIGIGDGGDPGLAQAIRVHANLVENAPIFVLLLLLAEATAALPVLALHAIGVVFVVARFAHAWGLSKSTGKTPGRFVGILTSWGVLVVLAAALLVRAVQLG
jgi:uncharacterized protein